MLYFDFTRYYVNNHGDNRRIYMPNHEFWELITLYVNSVRVVSPRFFRDRSDPLSVYNDEQFRMRFRLSKNSVVELANAVHDQLLHGSCRIGVLPPIYQILIAFRFYASGSFQVRNIGPCEC